MEKAVVNFRIDKTTKKEMEEICEDIGISIGTAFNIFAKKLIRERSSVSGFEFHFKFG